MPKPISQLIPDFREALKDGIKDAAENIVEGLIEDGPYWDGVFAASWEVKKGQRTITTYPINMSAVKRGRTAKTKPKDVKFLLPAIPNNENLEGYTIGNMTRYRGYAMDLLPTPVGRQMGNAPNKTARKDWYLRYVQGGRMQKKYNEAMTNVFKKY
tara:strand:+ start:60 stop:527 length:468 start_codon:yes stop_codon:yes gene_type:complete